MGPIIVQYSMDFCCLSYQNITHYHFSTGRNTHYEICYVVIYHKYIVLCMPVILLFVCICISPAFG